jgi:hypothetical protein
MSQNVLGFELEWFDPLSSGLKSLFLKYFIDDSTIEILEKERTFLKRIFYPEVKLEDLFCGNTVNIYSRVMVVKAYANSATTKYFAAREIHLLVSVTSDGTSVLLRFVQLLEKYQQLRLARVKSTVDDIDDIARSGDILFELVTLKGAAECEAFKKGFKSLAAKNSIRMLELSADEITVSLFSTVASTTTT